MTNESRLVPLSALRIITTLATDERWPERFPKCWDLVQSAIAATPTTQPEAVHASGQSQVDGMLKIVDQWQMGKKKTFAAMDEISYLVAGWGQTPPTPEAERLAVEIADRYAKHDVREYSHCNGWYRPHPNDSDWWNKRIIYLDLRGLLEHHPDHPEWVRVKG